jgi:hypothetical protein
MQKFIITQDGVFKYGNVRMHKDLLEAGDSCYGGGFYEFDYISNRLLLSGRSYDFGTPMWHHIDILKMPEAFRGLTVLYEGSPVSNFVKIEYVFC